MKNQLIAKAVVLVAALSAINAYGNFPVGTATTPFLTGQNYWYYPPDSAYPTVISNSDITLVRIGGHTFDTTPLTDAQILHQVDMIRSIGAEPLIQISRYSSTVTAAGTVQYINITNGRNVKYWSIGNEPDLNYSGTDAQLGASIASYITQLAPAMRDVDPTITIMAPDLAWYTSSKFSYLLGGASDITGTDSKGRYYIDYVSFHRYGSTGWARTNALNDMHGGFENNYIVPFLNQINSANSLHGRTGSSGLGWALTEFNITTSNPANNNPAGYGVSSFLNGHFFAEYYRVAMKYQVGFMAAWSMLEGGGNGSSGDLGYLGGSWSAPVPRASYYHMQMIGDYLLPGGYLDATSTATNVAVLATSTSGQTTLSTMILNEDTFDHTFSLRMDDGTVTGSGDTKINIAANLPVEYSGTIGQQSTLVLIFDMAGTLLKRVTYSLGLYQSNAAPVVEIFDVVAAPTFSPAPSTYSTAQAVTITSVTPGASIRYTTDGTTPTSTTGTLYTGPVTISATTTLKAIAYKSGSTDSTVTTGTYTISTAVPAAPTGLTATAASSSQISLAWSASSGATSYNVKRATVSGGPYTIVATGITSTGFDDTGLAASTTFYYVVSASNVNGESLDSTEASATTPAGNTGTTVAFEAESLGYTSTGASTSVNSDTGASGGAWVQLNATGTGQYVEFTSGTIAAGTYSVQLLYKANNNRGQLSFSIDGTVIGSLDQYASAITWPNATVGTVTFASSGTHLLRLTVTGKNASSTGYLLSADKFTFVAQANQAPSAPTGLTATAGNAQAALNWTASSGATGYNVKRATVTGGPYTTLTNVTTTSYTDTTALNDTTYYYVVSAVNSAGESANSTEAIATPACSIAAAPTGLTATAGDAQVALIWTAASGATSYNVKRATVTGGPYTTIASPTGTSYTDTTAVNGATYYYVVSAVNSCGESGNSTEVSATPTAAPPSFVAAGTVASGVGAITPALPSGITSGDVLLLFIETANQAVSISNPNGGTWTEITGSPQGTGTAGGTSATRLTVFWSRYNGTQGAPTVSDSGDHQIARMIAIRGATASGNPWDVTAGGIEATADTSGSIPGATTTVANTLIVVAATGNAPDANGTSNFSSWSNANLTSLAERTDNTRASGNGGALGIATGVMTATGTYGNTTVTMANSVVKGMISIAIKK